MTQVPADLSGKGDAELIAEVRAGKIASYGPLYERHHGAARNLARQLAKSASEAEDFVSEAFSKVLDTLRAGKGPDAAFRPYLLTAVRHVAYDVTRAHRGIQLTEDLADPIGKDAEALSESAPDPVIARLERTLAAKAFARLPERWQAVLWHTEIEQQSPAEVAPLLGLSPNGVSALAYRAREGLRQAYLLVHLAENHAGICRETAGQLGAYTRDGLSKRERAKVERHLDKCEKCRVLAGELSDINGSLRAIIAPMVLGGAVVGYLAAIGAAKTGAVTATAGASTRAARQFTGVAASGAVAAAVVAIALAAGDTQQLPTAAPIPAARSQADGASDVGGRFAQDGVHLHTEPNSTSATKGLAYRSHPATVHCLAPKTGNEAYFSVTDNATGTTGYVAEPYVAPDRKVRTC